MSLQATDIADLVTTTLNELGELKFTDLMSDYQDTIFLKRLMKKNKMTFRAGPEVQFNAIVDTNGSARAVGLYYTANVNPTNVMITGKMPWRHVTWNWGIDRREIAMNRTPRKIVDLAKTRRLAAFGDAVKFFEARGWRCPAVDDADNFHGIPYWIVKSATARTTNNGFNGTVPSGYSVVANINPTTYPRFANMALPYTNVSKDDLIDQLWYAMTWTNFKPLTPGIPQYDTGMDRALYTVYDVIAQLKRILESSNDDLGPDIDSMDGELVFRRVPFQWARELEGDTSAPIYGVDWGVFHAMGLSDEWLHETAIPVHSNQPTVSATHTDSSLNTYCTDRRKLFVVSKSTAGLS
jgi:hypothetical protein